MASMAKNKIDAQLFSELYITPLHQDHSHQVSESKHKNAHIPFLFMFSSHYRCILW